MASSSHITPGAQKPNDNNGTLSIQLDDTIEVERQNIPRFTNPALHEDHWLRKTNPYHSTWPEYLWAEPKLNPTLFGFSNENFAILVGKVAARCDFLFVMIDSKRTELKDTVVLFYYDMYHSFGTHHVEPDRRGHLELALRNMSNPADIGQAQVVESQGVYIMRGYIDHPLENNVKVAHDKVKKLMGE